MTTIPFIDIHTHRTDVSHETVQVTNLFPGNKLPEFKGRNFYSIGLHPWKLGTRSENDISLGVLQELMEIDHVVFVGECGLDKVSGADYNEQKRVFEAQAIIAEEFNKPLMIHCVRAYNEIAEIHKNMRPSVPWIFHGYSGSPEMTDQLTGKGFHFSFGKLLFSSKAKAIASIKRVPLHEIFLETDEFSGNISEIYDAASILLDIPVANLKESVWKNFNRLENVSIDY